MGRGEVVGCIDWEGTGGEGVANRSGAHEIPSMLRSTLRPPPHSAALRDGRGGACCPHRPAVAVWAARSTAAMPGSEGAGSALVLRTTGRGPGGWTDAWTRDGGAAIPSPHRTCAV